MYTPEHINDGVYTMDIRTNVGVKSKKNTKLLIRPNLHRNSSNYENKDQGIHNGMGTDYILKGITLTEQMSPER